MKKILLTFFFAFFLFSNLKVKVVWANPWEPCCNGGANGCRTYDPNTGWRGVCVTEPWQCAGPSCWWGGCSSSCNGTNTYYCQGPCNTWVAGSQACNTSAPAQSCPTSCHSDTQYVSNGSCGTTTCGSNAPAAQACPTSCHTNTQYVSNGACGTTTCGPNAGAAGTCPTTCHTNVITVSDGACGLTTCAPNAPAAGTCAACHTNTYNVPNGSCGSITCLPNAPSAGTCPVTCGYAGGTVPDGNCGTITCPSFASFGCYFSLKTANADPGVVSTGRILGFDGNIATKMSAPQWQVADGSENLSQPIYDYAYFSQKVTGCTTFSKTWNYGQMKKLDGCYTVPAGDRVLDQTAIDLDPGKKVILVVDGNVTVDRQITVPTDGFFAIIASGDITFGPDVGVTSSGGTGVLIQGVFIANGAINTGVGNSGHEKFVGQGMFIAYNGFNLQRTLGDSGNPYRPAELFEYRPDFLVNFPSQLGIRRISWKEVAP